MNKTLSQLRQRLQGKLAQIEAIMGPAFQGDPIFPGSVFLSRHRCGKKGCHCMTRDELHETLRLQIRFKDRTDIRCLSKEKAEFWRARTEAYKRLRECGRRLRRWHREVLEIVEAIEQERKSAEGLEGKDRARALR